MKKGIKYSLKILGWLVAAILLVIVLSALLIQTRPVKNKIAALAEKQAGKALNGELKIGKIDGNFFTGLVLENVLLTFEKDTMAYIEKVDVRYNLRTLVERELSVSSAIIENPYFWLEQDKDSTWNVRKLVKPGTEEKDTAQTGTFNIHLNDVRIREATIETNALDTVIPARVENWNTHFSLFLGENEQEATIHEFSLSTRSPNFTVNRLTFNLKRDSAFIELTDFFLKTAQNQLEGKAQYGTETNREGSADFETTEIQLNEFRYFIPNLKIPAHPVVKIDAALHGDSAIVNLKLEDNEQLILIEASSPNLVGFLFNNKNQKLIYTLNGELNNIKPGHWIGNPGPGYFINGKLSASGEGINPADASLKINANFNETVIEKKRLRELQANLELNNGNLGGTISGDGEFGQFWINPQIRNLFEHPVYQAELTASNFNLTNLTGNDSLSSDINLTAHIEGEEFDPEKLSATAKIVFSGSRFREIQLDTLFADAGFRNKNLQIDSLWLQTKEVSLHASGNYNLQGPSDLSLSVQFEGIEEFRPYIPVEGLKTSGNFEARLNGFADSLQIAAELGLNPTQYNNMTLQQFKLNASALFAPGDTAFNAGGMAGELVFGKNKLDSVTFNVNGSLDSLFATVSVANSDLNTRLETGFVPGEELRFTIADWQINYKNQEWALQQPPALLTIDSLSYRLENFKLATAPSDSARFLTANGKITTSGEEDFRIEAGNIDLKQLDEMFEAETKASGILSIVLNLEGTATAPRITGNYELKEAAFNEYQFTRFNGDIGYENGQINFSTLIVPQDSGKVDITASLPLRLNLDTMGFHFNPKDSLDGKLIVEKFPLAILQTLNIAGNIAGYIQGEVTVDGTVEAPNPKGNLNLKNASVKIDEYGIDYRDIMLNLNFMRDRVVLDTLNIRTDDGTLSGTGQVNFASDFYRGDVSQSRIELRFNEFNPVNHRQFNMQLSGHASLGGKKGSVVYGGDLKIPQAEIYLPAILNMMGRMNVPEMPKPILVQEIEKDSLLFDSIQVQTFAPPKPDSVQFSYLDQFQGQLRVRIPKNTWIKNEDMRVEISGELELKKNKEFFELFGSVEVVRGQYDLLGKTFVIKEGTITFQGGEELAPRMNISATYSFRNPQRVEQELSVNITGTSRSPEVSFQLDGSSVSEGDALSYILFGKSMDQLTMTQQENMAGSGGNLAEKAAASLLSSQISDFLGDKLNVDYIEVSSDGSFDNATVTVGKYITNDLFVSYEQRFGETDDKEMAKYEVKLEYELFRFLFFELNNSSNKSGFDVVVKFDVK